MKNKNNIYKELGITRSFYSVFVKRFFDILLSFLAIVILSPILLLTYLLTIIFLGMPAIYKQSRPGKNHKVFHIYKFRSMTNKKDADGNLLPDAQRITWFGKLLRKTSLDELPQLFNILKGDMSIIGPRPRLVKDMIFYDEDVYKFYIVTPGLTGPTQASGRNKNTWEQVFEKDIAYAHKITFWNDLKIFFGTFISVFKNTGETHSNFEENKTEVKEQEYYYADYILRIGKISKEQYDLGIKLSNEIIQNKGTVTFHPELHNQNEADAESNVTQATEEKTENEAKVDDELKTETEPKTEVDDKPKTEAEANSKSKTKAQPKTGKKNFASDEVKVTEKSNLNESNQPKTETDSKKTKHSKN